jgi:16S rRNA (cytidine1402-2'-O)-methyltransferase
VALVSDAGTPSVSDPGYRLVRLAIEQGVAVFPIPGVSAAITALCASGLPTDAFVFQGFAPKKKGKRLELLRRLVHEPRTLVFYESPRRTATLVAEVHAVMGDRQAVLARELTKLHEEFIRGSLSEIEAALANRPPLKGECTLLVDGAPATDSLSDEALAIVLKEALACPDAHLSTIAKTIAQKHHLPRKRVYDMALGIRKQLEKSS